MDDIIKFECSGIKCDNKQCDFRDDSVGIKEYKEWLEKPCPKCGQVLLTKKDYYKVMTLLDIIKFFNKSFSKTNKSKLKDNTSVKVTLEFNGTDDINIKEVEK